MNGALMLATDRLVLRPLGFDDAPSLLALYSDPEVTRYYEIDPISSIDQARMLLDSFIAAGRFAITLQGAIVGSCGFIAWNRDYRSASLSYDLAREHWGLGLMQEALGALLGYGFDALLLNRVSAVTDPANARSIDTLIRLGFASEGLMRELGFWKGRFHDMLLFSLLKSDWEKRKSPRPA